MRQFRKESGIHSPGYVGTYKDYQYYDTVGSIRINHEEGTSSSETIPASVSNGSDSFDPSGMTEEQILDDIDRRTK